MKKLASEGAGCNSNMDIEYQKEIQKKKDSGMTEGKAVLDWLSKNEKENKAKTIKEAKDRSALLKLYRPNSEVK
jgi:hypothetical protein